MAKVTKKSTPKTPTTVKKSTRISKPVTKTTKAATKATPKKAPVVKKVNAKSNKAAPKKTERSTTTKENKCLEVCLLLDETASMMSWIDRSKETIKGIIE